MERKIAEMLLEMELNEVEKILKDFSAEHADSLDYLIELLEEKI